VTEARRRVLNVRYDSYVTMHLRLSEVGEKERAMLKRAQKTTKEEWETRFFSFSVGLKTGQDDAEDDEG
jgi:hypothetical protein